MKSTLRSLQAIWGWLTIVLALILAPGIVEYTISLSNAHPQWAFGLPFVSGFAILSFTVAGSVMAVDGIKHAHGKPADIIGGCFGAALIGLVLFIEYNDNGWSIFFIYGLALIGLAGLVLFVFWGRGERIKKYILSKTEVKSKT